MKNTIVPREREVVCLVTNVLCGMILSNKSTVKRGVMNLLEYYGFISVDRTNSQSMDLAHQSLSIILLNNELRRR